MTTRTLLLVLCSTLPRIASLGATEMPAAMDRISLTYPNQEVRLEAVLPGIALQVVAHQEPIVAVRWLDQRPDRDAPAVRLRENRNNVWLEVSSESRGRELEIAVPRKTSLSIRNEQSGSIYVDGLQGDQELESRFGDIHLERASGSAVLAAYYGSLKVSFEEVDAASALSLITFRGNIDLELPPDLGATLSLTLNSVRVNSEFALEVMGDRGPSRHVIGNGRTRIDITMNRGDLVLRAGTSPSRAD